MHYRYIIAKSRGRISGSAIRAGSFGLADQTVIAAVSFFVMIVAARALGPSSFGVFALLYTVMLLSQAFQESLITSPFTVLGATIEGDEYRRYTSSVVVVQSILALSIGGLLAAIAGIALALNTTFGTMLLAMSFATVAWQYHEFTRKVLYTESRFKEVLLNSIMTSGVRLTLLIVLLIRIELTGEHLFLLLGATWIGGGTFGFWQIRNSLTVGINRRSVHSVISNHWQFGGWLMGGNILSHLPRYLEAALMSSVLSVGAYGAVRASTQLINGANIPLQAMNNLLRPRLARDAQRGPHAVWDTMLPIMLIGGAAFAMFAVALILVREPLLGALFGAEYVQYAQVLFLVALLPLANLQRYMLSNALRAVRRTRAIFIGTVISALVGSSLGSVALLIFGLPAAGAIGLMGALVSVAWLGRKWRQYVEETTAHVTISEPTTDTIHVE